MSTPFDPYYKWLGVPPAEQPPNHYRLLGVNLYEADTDVIETAADGRMALLRSFHTGPNSDASQQLLNEVAAAKLCLLKPERRAKYDDELRQRLAEAASGAGRGATDEHFVASAQVPVAREGSVEQNLQSSPVANRSPVDLGWKHAAEEIAEDERLVGETEKKVGAWKGKVPEAPAAVSPLSAVLAKPVTDLPKLGPKPAVSRAKAWDLAVAEASAAQKLPRRRRRLQFSPQFAQLVFGSLVFAGLAYAGLAGFTMWQESEFKHGMTAPRVAQNEVAAAASGTASTTSGGPTVGGPGSSESHPPALATMQSDRPAEPGRNFGDASATVANFDTSAAGRPLPSTGLLPGHDSIAPPYSPSANQGASSAALIRSPVPVAATKQKAVKLLDEVLKKDIQSASGIEGQLALAHRLAELANQTTDDPVTRYVAAEKALEIAVNLGDVRLASDLVGGFCTYYEVDAWDLRAKTLRQLAAKARSADTRAVIAGAAFELVERALADNRPDAALDLATLTMNLANAGRDIPLREQARKLAERAETLKKSRKGIDAAERKLADDPNDAAANLTVGRYQCFVKGDWLTGLPYLVKGSDLDLRSLAQWELTQPLQATEQVKLADAWWDLAELRQGAKDNSEEKALRERAAYWYRLAMPGLEGISLAKAQKRSETQ